MDIIGNQAIADNIVVPATPSWARLVHWVIGQIDTIPTTLVPDLTKLFQAWLVFTNEKAAVNSLIVLCLYRWLMEFEHRVSRNDGRVIYAESDRWREVREDVRTTFLMFCHLQPSLAAQYLIALRQESPRFHDFRSILKFPGSLPTAAPSEFVDFILAGFIPADDPNDFSSRRYDIGPFDVHDHELLPVSPGQGPFFALLESAPTEGFRLVRELVEHAAKWRREYPGNREIPCPTITIPFPNGDKTCFGDFGTYQWARGGTGSLTVASALMAMEAWGHKQIEAGAPFNTVMNDVLGPDGSSVAFVCVAVDLALSHWDIATEDAWPLAASPELLRFDETRHSQDVSGMGRLFAPEAERSNWRVKLADLTGRPSRRTCLTERIGYLALNGPPDILTKIVGALRTAQERFEGKQLPDDEDSLHGLHATTTRALRMADRQNWLPRTLRLTDGREVEAFQFQPGDNDIAVLSAERPNIEANMAETSTRLGLQRALRG